MKENMVSHEGEHGNEVVPMLVSEIFVHNPLTTLLPAFVLSPCSQLASCSPWVSLCEEL